MFGLGYSTRPRKKGQRGSKAGADICSACVLPRPAPALPSPALTAPIIRRRGEVRERFWMLSVLSSLRWTMLAPSILGGGQRVPQVPRKLSWPLSHRFAGKSLPAGSPDAFSFGCIEAFKKVTPCILFHSFFCKVQRRLQA